MRNWHFGIKSFKTVPKLAMPDASQAQGAGRPAHAIHNPTIISNPRYAASYWSLNFVGTGSSKKRSSYRRSAQIRSGGGTYVELPPSESNCAPKTAPPEQRTVELPAELIHDRFGPFGRACPDSTSHTGTQNSHSSLVMWVVEQLLRGFRFQDQHFENGAE